MRHRSQKLAPGRLLALWIILFVGIAGCVTSPTPAPAVVPESTPTVKSRQIVLTMGGWRTSTGRMNQMLDEYHQAHPNITVSFDPVSSTEYDPVLQAQLEAGTAPDLFYLRSFSASSPMYDEGYLEPLTDLEGLKENFDSPMLSPWTSEDGVVYGAPFTATSHGIYYNQDLFRDLGLEIPQTWEDLLAAAETFQEAGYVPFANGTKDSWTSAEIVFMNLAPNFIGGLEGRLAYLNGERCFDDEHVVAAFRAVADLAPYLPENHELLGYIDSLQLFVQGKAPMWMSGSWDIPYFESAEPAFEWSVFAVPPPAGQPGVVTFHLDVGIGLNAASAHKAEAKEFLAWMTTPAFGELLGNELPGFFPMHRDAPTLTNEHANAFLALNQGRGTDIRFAWEELRDGTPSGYTLMQEGAEAILQGKQTPEAAAQALQDGLAEWYEPAQSCAQ